MIIVTLVSRCLHTLGDAMPNVVGRCRRRLWSSMKWCHGQAARFSSRVRPPRHAMPIFIRWPLFTFFMLRYWFKYWEGELFSDQFFEAFFSLLCNMSRSIGPSHWSLEYQLHWVNSLRVSSISVAGETLNHYFPSYHYADCHINRHATAANWELHESFSRRRLTRLPSPMMNDTFVGWISIFTVISQLYALGIMILVGWGFPHFGHFFLH